VKRLLLPVVICALALTACGGGTPPAAQTTGTAASGTGYLPAGVQTIDVSTVGLSRHVTDPQQVAQIVTWFNGLQPVQTGVHGACPLVIVGPRVTFDFRSGSGALLARATAPSGPSDRCNPISLSIGGAQQTPLIGGDFVRRVEGLLGVRLGPPLAS
jgi:hypothetical protein